MDDFNHDLDHGFDDDFDDGFDENELLRMITESEKSHIFHQHQPGESIGQSIGQSLQGEEILDLKLAGYEDPTDDYTLDHLLPVDLHHHNPVDNPVDNPIPNPVVEVMDKSVDHGVIGPDNRGENREKDWEISRLQAQLNTCKVQLKTKQETLESLQQDLMVKSGEISLIRKNLDQKKTENTFLRDSLTHERSAIDSSRGLVESKLNAEIQRLSTQLAFANQELISRQSLKENQKNTGFPSLASFEASIYDPIPRIPSQKSTIQKTVSLSSRVQSGKLLDKAFAVPNGRISMETSPGRDRRVPTLKSVQSIGINTEASDNSIEKHSEMDPKVLVKRLFLKGEPTLASCLAEAGKAEPITRFHEALCWILAAPNLQVDSLLIPLEEALAHSIQFTHSSCVLVLTKSLVLLTRLSDIIVDSIKGSIELKDRLYESLYHLMNSINSDNSSWLSLESQESLMEYLIDLIMILFRKGIQITPLLSRESVLAILDKVSSPRVQHKLCQTLRALSQESSVVVEWMTKDQSLVSSLVSCISLAQQPRFKSTVFDLLFQTTPQILPILSDGLILEGLVDILYTDSQSLSDSLLLDAVEKQVKLLYTLFANGKPTLKKSSTQKKLISSLGTIGLSCSFELLELVKDLLCYLIEDPESVLEALE